MREEELVNILKVSKKTIKEGRNTLYAKAKDEYENEPSPIDFDISDEDIVKGIETTKFPARIEVIRHLIDVRN